MLPFCARLRDSAAFDDERSPTQKLFAVNSLQRGRCNLEAPTITTDRPSILCCFVLPICDYILSACSRVLSNQ